MRNVSFCDGNQNATMRLTPGLLASAVGGPAPGYICLLGRGSTFTSKFRRRRGPHGFPANIAVASSGTPKINDTFDSMDVDPVPGTSGAGS